MFYNKVVVVRVHDPFYGDRHSIIIFEDSFMGNDQLSSHVGHFKCSSCMRFAEV